MGLPLKNVGPTTEEYKKNVRERENLRKKILARQLILKNNHAINNHAMPWKKIHTRNLIMKRIPAARKSPPLHNGGSVPNLGDIIFLTGSRKTGIIRSQFFKSIL